MDKIRKLKPKNSCMAIRKNYLCVSTSTTLTLYDVASGSVINSIRAKRSFGYLEFLSDEIILVECDSEYGVVYHLPDFELISRTKNMRLYGLIVIHYLMVSIIYIVILLLIKLSG